MRVLLDTHVLLWALSDPERLSADTHQLVKDPSTELVVSAASIFEISVKHRLGKLPEASTFLLGVRPHLGRLRAVDLPISAEHALLAGGLSWSHRDPFDRMLAAQSIIEGLPLMTGDVAFEHIAGVRVIW